MTRRELLALSATSLSTFHLAAQTAVNLKVGGDYSTQFENWLTREAEKHWDQREREISSLNADGIRKRAGYIRATMLELIGGLPAEKTPLQAKITGGFQRESYRVENIIFESQPGFRVTGNLYLPKVNVPVPAVIGVAGHSSNGKASFTYQHAFIEFAKRGFAVFAIDPPGQGERLEYFVNSIDQSIVGVGVPEHNMAGLQCLLTGQTFARYEIWDGIRALDYLLTRPEIDPNRIAVAGNSGGGTQAAYLAVFEPRIAAVVSSCYMTRWRELWSGPGPQDAEQIFPRFIEKGLDFGDFMLSDPGRPYLMTTAIRDFFPIDGARITFKQTQRLFDLFANGEKAGYFEFDDTHGWSKPRREAAYRWLQKWFRHSETAAGESDIETEEESLLYATSTGQISTSGGSESVRSLNRKLLPQLISGRQPVTRDLIQNAIGLKELPSVPQVKIVGSDDHQSYLAEKLELIVEGGVKIPAILFLPSNHSESKKVILYSSSFEKAGDPDIRELIRAGHIVMTVDPRGIGESYRPPTKSGYTQPYQLSARAILLGRNLVEMQTADLLSAIGYLATHPQTRTRKIILYSKGETGPANLFAAALSEKIEQLILEKTILSYQSIIEADIHYNLERTVIPGILRHLDLTDVIKILNAQRLIISPVRPNGTMMLKEEAIGILKNALLPHELVIRGESRKLQQILTGLFI